MNHIGIMNRMKRCLAFLCMLGLLPVYSAMGQQDRSVQGRVLNADGNSVGQAVVTVKGADGDAVSQATTDEEGRFTVRAEEGQRLQVVSQNHSSKTVPVQEEEITVTLGDDNFSIPLGYGIERDQDELTAAVDVATASDLDETPKMTMNVGNALYGQLPGLMVLENSGTPPTNPSLFIRGRSSFTGSSPLILVDGFRRPLSAIAQEEIQSVKVLKDAAALAKFGQEGANGVLLITTKRGDTDGLEVNASVNMGLTQPTALPDMVGAPAYAQAVNEARANDGLDPRYSPEDLQGFTTEGGSALYPNEDLQDELLREYGVRSKVNVSFQGGGDQARYFTMLNYVRDSGLFGPVNRNEDYNTQLKYSRFRFRTNLDVDITETLLLQSDVTANLVEQNLPSGGGGGGADQIFDALYTLPTAAYPLKTPSGAFGGRSGYPENPLGVLTSTGFGQPNSREFSLSGRLRQDMSELVEGLSAEVTVNYNNFGSFFENQDRSFAYESLELVRNQSGEILDTTVTQLGEATDLTYDSGFSNKRQFVHLRGQLNYERSLGAHTLGATAMFKQGSRAFDGRDAINHRRNFFGTVHAGISNKYFLDVSASYGGNNRVPAGSRYELYPAVSAAWMLSREGFLEDVGVLDRLKLRASWGIVGSDDLPTRNPWESFYDGAIGYRFTNNNNYWQGFAEQRAPAIDFGVEKSQKTNVGLDAAFLDNRLQLSTDVFYTRTSNILADGFGRYSSILGVFPPENTNGIVENRGMEAALQWRDQGDDWSYHIGGRFSFARNEIVEQNEVFREEDYLRRTGEPVGQVFGLEAIGFFEDQQEIANSPEQNFGEVKPGDIKYKDQNGDGVINELDEVPMGHSSQYPEMYFSSTIGGSYKGFSVSALFQGTANYTAYLNTPGVFRPMRNNNTISTHYYNRRWTPASAGEATYPRLSVEENSNNYRPSSLWITDRSYVKLRSLKVSYSLPSSVIAPLQLDGLQIVLRGQNLFSIDDIPVLDPEHLSSGYPILRSYSAGVEVQL